MNAMEIITLVLGILVLLKLLTFLMKPKMLSNMGHAVSKNSKMLAWGILCVVIVLGYFVLSDLTVVQAIPAILLGHTILALLLIQYPKAYDTLVVEMFRDTKKSWLIWLIWVGLVLWAFYEMFM